MSLSRTEWSFDRQNLLLEEFGLPAMLGFSDAPGFADSISSVTDADLIEMYALVTGVELGEVVDSVGETGAGNWKQGYARMFLSHSAAHKGFAGDVARELAVVGIHGFVAHDTMEYSRPWQEQIENALRTMDVFVALVHPEFLSSAWCNQEVGWALGMRVPRYVIRVDGTDPVGFVGKDQWPSAPAESPNGAAKAISAWASSIPEVSDVMVAGLFAALENANNYIDAGAAATRITTVNSLTDQQWNRLANIYWGNDQLNRGALANRALMPFFLTNGREWPPIAPSS
jgi:hypothetical protein